MTRGPASAAWALRELCHTYRPMIAPGWLIVMVAKSAAAEAAFSDLREEWLLLARRLTILPPPPDEIGGYFFNLHCCRWSTPAVP